MKIIRYLIILILFIGIFNLSAGSKFYLLEDFDKKNIQTIYIPEKDAILFDYKQGRHAIIFDRFNTKDGIDINIYIYQKSYKNTSIEQSVSYLSLKSGMHAIVDFDKDLVDDLKIEYLRQIKEKAVIEFTAINVSDINNINSRTDLNLVSTSSDNKLIDKSENPDYKTAIGLSISFGIVLLGILLYLIIINRKK